MELQSPGRFRKRFVKASSLPGSVKYCFFLNEVLQKLVSKMNVSFLKFINQDRETGVFGFLFVGHFHCSFSFSECSKKRVAHHRQTTLYAQTSITITGTSTEGGRPVGTSAPFYLDNLRVH